MANQNIRTSECSWHQTSLTLLGRKIRGLRGWEYKEASEDEHLYGAGKNPLDIQEGNVAYTGNVKILGFELDALNKRAVEMGYASIVQVPHEAILATLKYQKTPADEKVNITIRGIKFQEQGSTMEQGAKMREITLPFLAMDIQQS